MSATRDPSQKVSFVYSNLYSLYQKGKDAARSANPAGLTRVIKTDAAEEAVVRVQSTIRPYRPIELLAKRQEKIHKQLPAESAVKSLKKNLEDLNDLHSRLKFMLAELEDLSKDDKE